MNVNKMKTAFLFLLVTFVSLSSQQTNIDGVFEAAAEFQTEVSNLKRLRVSLSEIMNNATMTALSAFEGEIEKILMNETEVNDELYEKLNLDPSNYCIQSLITLLHLMTELGGYPTTNCMRTYSREVEYKLDEIQSSLNHYAEMHNELSQLSLRPFTEYNVFTNRIQILDRFANQYNNYISRVEDLRCELNELKNLFKESIDLEILTFEGCMLNVTLELSANYATVRNRIPECARFSM